MKKGLFFLLFAGVLVYADDSLIFEQKQEEKIKDININIPDKNTNNVNISSLNNIKKDSENVTINLNNEKMNIDDVKDFVNSEKFKKNLESTRKSIVNDKEMIYQQMNINLDGKINEKVVVNKNEKVNTTPKYLDEPIIIFISSSMDKELIRTYFRTFKKANQDVEFVINGLIPDSGTKIMPTINYVKDLLGNDYIFNVDINPLKFQEYKVDRVPAIAYKKFIHIGAVSPIEALETIYNKDTTNNKPLKTLLNNL